MCFLGKYFNFTKKLKPTLDSSVPKGPLKKEKSISASKVFATKLHAIFLNFRRMHLSEIYCPEWNFGWNECLQGFLLLLLFCGKTLFSREMEKVFPIFYTSSKDPLLAHFSQLLWFKHAYLIEEWYLLLKRPCLEFELAWLWQVHRASGVFQSHRKCA